MQTHRNTCTAWLLNSVIKFEFCIDVRRSFETEKGTRSKHLFCSSYGWSFYVRCAVVLTMPAMHISSVVGILLFAMRLIWHGLNNYLPASDWHSHKKGWVGLGSRWWHSTWPNWSISMLGRRCSTGGQHHTIYFTIYGAQTHGHQ